MVVCLPEITMGCRVSSLNATNKELETTINKPYAAFEAFSRLKPQSLSKHHHDHVSYFGLIE